MGRKRRPSGSNAGEKRKQATLADFGYPLPKRQVCRYCLACAPLWLGIIVFNTGCSQRNHRPRCTFTLAMRVHLHNTDPHRENR